jgi:ABC-type glycerol-3-phosphate transport system substrate-binding protein
VAGLWHVQLAQFAAMGALEPLDDLAAQHGLNASYYKPVYYRGCQYKGRLYAVPCTPAATALHWNKTLFKAKATELRAAGLDPDRPPRTLQELDRYAKILDTWGTRPNGTRRLVSAGYLPAEPGWYLPVTPFWFGGQLYDPQRRVLMITDAACVAAFDWMASFSRRLGKEGISEFRSGFGVFDSPQNAFLTGDVAMVKQGPWMANYIENNKPSMNNVRNLTHEQELALPPEQRKTNYEWGVAPFPSAVPGLENVAFCDCDILVIPRGSRHKREAFEFLAFINRRDVMERLCSSHSKHSPLAVVSQTFIRQHKNPYIDVFESIAASPNAHCLPELPVWPELSDELTVASQRVCLLQASPEEALRDAMKRVQPKVEAFFRREDARAARPEEP